MLGNLLGGFIVIIIGASLFSPVSEAVYTSLYRNATTASNITGASAAIANLTTLFFALGVMTAGMALTVQGLRNAGVM